MRLLRDRNKLWLCVAPLLAIAIDVALTLNGQGAQYWAGDYHLANEASPPGNWLLVQHPLAFIAGMVTWTAFLSLIILALPRIASQILALALVIGHTWGAVSWFRHVFDVSYWSSIAYFALMAACVVLTWHRTRGHL